MAVHMVLDNYGTHKTPAVKRWFLRHPEYHLHFTPTSAFVAEPGGAVLRRRSPRSGSAAGRSAAWRNWSRRSWSTWPSTTRTPSRSCGPPTPTRSSNGSRGFVNGLLTQDTRVRALTPLSGVRTGRQLTSRSRPRCALLRAEVRDDVLLLQANEPRSVPVQGADVPNVPSVRVALPVYSETEGTGLREAQAADVMVREHESPNSLWRVGAFVASEGYQRRSHASGWRSVTRSGSTARIVPSCP